jgi:hypothetical protein
MGLFDGSPQILQQISTSSATLREGRSPKDSLLEFFDSPGTFAEPNTAALLYTRDHPHQHRQAQTKYRADADSLSPRRATCNVLASTTVNFISPGTSGIKTFLTVCLLSMNSAYSGALSLCEDDQSVHETSAGRPRIKAEN